MAVRAAIVAALDALEDGDADYAVALLLGALEDGPRPVGVACQECGARFDWPGLRDHHLRVAHDAELELREVA